MQMIMMMIMVSYNKRDLKDESQYLKTMKTLLSKVIVYSYKLFIILIHSSVYGTSKGHDSVERKLIFQVIVVR